jgi:hypothetical protein
VLLDKTLPAHDVDADIHTVAPIIGRSFDFFGDSSRLEVIAPIADGTWDFKIADQDSNAARSGFGDPVVRFVWNFFGAPALRVDEFLDFKPSTIAGVVVRVRVPLGEYDSSRLLNLGVNRWMFSPRFGVSHRFDRWVLEAYASTWFFTDNTDFLQGNTLSQKSLFAFQAHCIYRIGRGFWTSASIGRATGGETSVNGVPKDDASKNTRVGLGLAVPLHRQVIVKMAWTTGLTTTAGNDFSTFLVGLQYAWGAR